METMNGNGLIAWHCQDCGVPNTEDPSSSNLGEPALESTRLSEAPEPGKYGYNAYNICTHTKVIFVPIKYINVSYLFMIYSHKF